jgi:hypothetical protein
VKQFWENTFFVSDQQKFGRLAGNLLADVVQAETDVGGVGVGDGGTVGIGVSSIAIGVSGVEEGISISLSFPLLAAVEVGGAVVASIGGIAVSGGAGDGDVGGVDAGGGLEGGESVAVGVGESSVEESWVSLGLSLSVDGGDKGEKNNLKTMKLCFNTGHS